MGIFKNKQEKLDRLEKRLIKKGKSPERIKARLETRSKLQDVGKGLGKIVGGAATHIISAAPFPVASAGKLLSKIPAIKDVNVLGPVVAAAEIQFDANVIEYGSIQKAVMSEFVPLLEDIKDGEYLSAGIGAALLIGSVIAFLVLV